MEHMNPTERMAAFTREYPGYTMTNLETKCVHGHMTDPSKVLVRTDHPAVVIIVLNRDVMGIDIIGQEIIDGDWYEVDRAILVACCAAIRVFIMGLRSPLCDDAYDTVIKPVPQPPSL